MALIDYVNKAGLTTFWLEIKNKIVMKEDGKGLSTNDYTNEEKQNLADRVNVPFITNEEIEQCFINAQATIPDSDTREY